MQRIATLQNALRDIGDGCQLVHLGGVDSGVLAEATLLRVQRGQVEQLPPRTEAFEQLLKTVLNVRQDLNLPLVQHLLVGFQLARHGLHHLELTICQRSVSF